MRYRAISAHPRLACLNSGPGTQARSGLDGTNQTIGPKRGTDSSSCLGKCRRFYIRFIRGPAPSRLAGGRVETGQAASWG